MTNSQVRMFSSVLLLLAGAVLSLSNNVDVNVSLFIILLGVTAFVAEYIRMRRQ